MHNLYFLNTSYMYLNTIYEMSDAEQKIETKQCQRCYQTKPITKFKEMTTKITNNCLKCLEKIQVIKTIKFEIDHDIDHDNIDEPQTIKFRRYLCDYDELCKIIKNHIKNKYPDYIFRVIDLLDFSDFEIVFVKKQSLKYLTTQFYAKNFPNLKCIEHFTVNDMNNKIDADILRIETIFAEILFKFLDNGDYKYIVNLPKEKIEHLIEQMKEIKNYPKIKRMNKILEIADSVETFMCRDILLPNNTVYELLRALNDNYPDVGYKYNINGFKFENRICRVDWF